MARLARVFETQLLSTPGDLAGGRYAVIEVAVDTGEISRYGTKVARSVKSNFELKSGKTDSC